MTHVTSFQGNYFEISYFPVFFFSLARYHAFYLTNMHIDISLPTEQLRILGNLVI